MKETDRHLSDVNNQAHEYFENKEFDKAIECLETIDNFPNYLKPNLAKCYYYASKVEKALQLMEEVEDKNSDVLLDYALYKNAY